MNSILILISSSPESSHALEALKLARNMKQRGREVAVYLLHDAIYHALPKGSQQVGAYDGPGKEKEITWYCLEEDLAMRGYQREEIVPRVRLSSYDELVEMMTERYDKTIGVF